MLKSKTAALEVPEFVTVALDHASQVVTDPTAIVAAVQVSPLSHCGIVKLNTAALEVQLLVTLASVQG